MRIKNIKRGHKTLTKQKARLIAHLIGDGCVYKCRTDYNIKYEVKDIDLLNQFEDDLFYVYGLKPTLGFNPSGKTGNLIPYVRLRSKRAFEDLKTYCEFDSSNWSVPTQFSCADKDIKIEFLRALFDDEGSVIPQHNNAIVRLYSINLTGLLQVKAMIEELDIPLKIVPGFGDKRNVYAITIKDIKLFYDKLGFHSIRKQARLEQYIKNRRRLPFSQSPLPDSNRGSLGTS